MRGREQRTVRHRVPYLPRRRHAAVGARTRPPRLRGRWARAYLDGVIVDVTRTRLAEAALRAGEERFRHLAEHATDLICRYSPDGVCLYASPSAVTITGYKPNELIGRSAYDFIHPDDAESSAATHVKVLMADARETVTYRFRRKDGVWIWMQSVIHGTRDGETHALIDLSASARDITERRGENWRRAARPSMRWGTRCRSSKRC
ncbi:MAG: PAS domain S-box protein [Armatimonadetes bacterium]|nr:PAS domain S-box protein [Armatimonadota bacterium]